MDKSLIHFDEATHTYSRTDTGFVFQYTGSRLAEIFSHTDYKFVNKALLEAKAEFGTKEHLAFEWFLKYKKVDTESENLKWFIEHLYNEYDFWLSEEVVYTEGLPVDYAGTIDLLAFKDGKLVAIFDIKTGKVNKKAVKFQLNFYRFAYCRMFEISTEGVKLYCLDAKGKDSKILEIAGIADAVLIEMLSCLKEGVPYIGKDVVELDDYIDVVDTLQRTVMEMRAQAKKAEDEFLQAKAEIEKLMKDNDVKTFETALIKFTICEGKTSKSLDMDKINASEKFKKTLAEYEALPVVFKKGENYLRVTEKKGESA